MSILGAQEMPKITLVCEGVGEEYYPIGGVTIAARDYIALVLVANLESIVAHGGGELQFFAYEIINIEGVNSFIGVDNDGTNDDVYSALEQAIDATWADRAGLRPLDDEEAPEGGYEH